MQRIEGPTATPENQFTEGNPAINEPATVVSAKWLNDVQEELAQTVELGGVTLDSAKKNQTGDFITNSNVPVNLVAGFKVAPVTSIVPAVDGDILGTAWLFNDGLAAGSANPVLPNFYINTISNNLEIEGLATAAGDYFELTYIDLDLNEAGNSYSQDTAFQQRSSSANFPNSVMTKCCNATVYNAGVAVSIEVFGQAANTVVHSEVPIINNGETKQALLIEKDTTGAGFLKYTIRITLNQPGNFFIQLGGVGAFLGRNKLPPFNLSAPDAIEKTQAGKFYQTGSFGKASIPCVFFVNPLNLARGFCSFPMPTDAAADTITITNLVVDSLKHGQPIVTAAAPTIIIDSIFSNGFAFRVLDNEAVAYDFLDVSFDYELWRN